MKEILEKVNNIDIIRAVFDKNPSNIQKSFNVAVGRKVLDAIEAKKAEVGTNLFRK